MGGQSNEEKALYGVGVVRHQKLCTICVSRQEILRKYIGSLRKKLNNSCVVEEEDKTMVMEGVKCEDMEWWKVIIDLRVPGRVQRTQRTRSQLSQKIS